MTRNSSLFCELQPCNYNYKVRIADGSLITVIGFGRVKILDVVILESILLVPKLSYNFLSINKLTQDLKCIATFSPLNVY